MIFTPEQYINASPIQFPYESKTGLIIDEFIGHCKKCHNTVESIKGIVNEYPNCIEFRCAGVCHPCKLITSFHFRYYNDGRILHNKDAGWTEVSPKSNWYNKFVNKIKTI